MGEALNKRKLTTILATDVVGYSRLMTADEEATLRRFKQYRALIESLIAKHAGRPFGAAGDSLMAEFGSAVEAVRCAISIQEELAVRNADLPQATRMLFRIGINVGDVIVDGELLFGDGVNVAARLESLAEAGGICLSGSTFEQVKNRLSIGFEDMGQHKLKNIADPVAAFKVVQGPIAIAAPASPPAPVGPGRALAVVPPRRRFAPAALGAVAAAVLAAAGLGAWYALASGDGAEDRFAAEFRTDSLRAPAIRATMAGVKIQGLSARADQPFSIELQGSGKAILVMKRSGKLEGTLLRDSGRWWAEDYRFCMQFTRFAQGRRLCPRIARRGEKVTATRGDGTPLRWALYK